MNWPTAFCIVGSIWAVPATLHAWKEIIKDGQYAGASYDLNPIIKVIEKGVPVDV